MSCDLCRIRPVTHTVNEGIVKVGLCTDCYNRYVYMRDWGMVDDIEDYFDRFIFDDYNPVNAYMQRKTLACPYCGWTLDDVEDGYKFGCSKCYDYFSDKVGEYFSNLRGEEYNGKYFGYENKSKGRRLSQMTVKDIPFLKSKLQEAIKNGENSKASAIEKRIKQLQGEMI